MITKVKYEQVLKKGAYGKWGVSRTAFSLVPRKRKVVDCTYAKTHKIFFVKNALMPLHFHPKCRILSKLKFQIKKHKKRFKADLKHYS